MKGKFSLSFFTMLCAVLVIFSTSTTATENFSKKFEFDSLKEELLQEIKKEYPNARFIDLTDDEYEDYKKNIFKLMIVLVQ